VQDAFETRADAFETRADAFETRAYNSYAKCIITFLNVKIMHVTGTVLMP